jgi:hypothetical protein
MKKSDEFLLTRDEIGVYKKCQKDYAYREVTSILKS